MANAHVTSLKFYNDSSLGITEYVQQAFEHLFNQRGFHIEEFSIWRAPNVAYEVLVQWQSISECERLWEPLASRYRDALPTS